MIKIRVPATSANLGPGFDCLGLALDIWNEVGFDIAEETSYHVSGEGADKLSAHPNNLLIRAMQKVFEVCEQKHNVIITAQNQIWLSSGLGSSAAAIVAGMCGANELLNHPLTESDLLRLATQMEGHPDNAAPALLGGLVVSAMSGEKIITRHYDVPDWNIVIVKPDVYWPTHKARAVLPKRVSRADAVFNIGRAALVVEALRSGDLDLLKDVMDDRIHQPYRLNQIQGAREAFAAAKQFGAAALSGAGPSIICFTEAGNTNAAIKGIQAAFENQGVHARGLETKPSLLGAHTI